MVTVVKEIYLCPVCLNPVEKTRKGMIAGHFIVTEYDADRCPGGGETFDIAVRDGLPLMTFRRRERERLIEELRVLQQRSAEIVDKLAVLDEL